MTYFQQSRGSRHSHRYNVIDEKTREAFCICGKAEADAGVNKYNAHSTQYEGQTYHSAFEAGYAAELDIRVRAKDIKSWERQVKIPLKVGGIFIANYYIDFVVEHNDGSFEWVEVKGAETELWRMKWKILEVTFEDHKRTPDDRLLVVKQRTDWRAAIERPPVDNSR